MEGLAKAGSRPPSYEVVILVRENDGDLKCFSDVCYRGKFMTEEDFIQARARLISSRAASGFVDYGDGTYITFSTPGDRIKIPADFSREETPSKYLNYIRDLRTPVA